MAIDRTAVLRGPCVCTFTAATSGAQTLTFFTKEDVTLDIEYDTWDLSVSAFGKIDERMRGSRALVNVVPCGVFTHGAEGANYGILWPLASTAAGTSIINPAGAYDGSFYAEDAAGNHITLHGAYIKKMPGFTLSTQKCALTQMQFASIGAKNTERTAAAFMYTLGTSGTVFTTASSAFDTADILVDQYTGVWGSVTGLTSIDTQEGFNIEFDTQTTELRSDSYGLFDETLSSLNARCRFSPVGQTMSDLLTAAKFENTGALTPGVSMGSQQASDLTISGTAATTGKNQLVIVIKQAFMKKVGFQYGFSKFRNSEVEFVASRTVSSGANGALFSVTATPHA